MITNGYTNHLSLLWKEYKLVGGDDLRNKLVEMYLPIAKYNAERIWERLPKSIELGDLVSAAVFGLMDAIEGFDITRGVKFETYCVLRIRGAIIDELRNTDWVPRLVRHRTKMYNEAISTLSSGVNDHKPSLTEVADYLDISIEEADCIEKESTNIHLLQENEECQSDEESYGRRWFVLNQMPDKNVLQPFDKLSEEDSFEELISCLRDNDQIIFKLYYRQDFSMKEIGEILGFTESRISQRHDMAIQKIKDCFF